MPDQKQLALSEASEWLGDWHPLAEQLGSADGLVTLGSVTSLLRLPPVQDVPSLKQFLENYRTQLLLPYELPAIQAAYGHALRQELAELVALDQQLALEASLQPFAEPSRRVGRAQLQKLRPLRDLRIVQRYLQAVEAGEAQAWHTLVYGLTMAIYSLPLRQGLVGYGHQTTRSFIYSAARMLQLSERECRELFDEHCADLPAAVDALVKQEAAA
jgi:urease accessory protein UreF